MREFPDECLTATGRSFPTVLKKNSLNNRIGSLKGLITEKIPYEISKSWDFAKDFRISGKISRFQERFQDFTEISRFHLRFQDFTSDFRISRKIMQDFQISMKISARFQ